MLIKPIKLTNLRRCSKHRFSEQGITFIENIVASVVFTTSMLAVGTAFLGQRMDTLTGAITTGAAVAAQQVTDDLRQTNPTAMPSSGTVTLNNVSTNPLTVMGYKYGTTVTYCPTGSVACSNSSKQVRVKVSFNGKTLYAVDTVYTDFESVTESDSSDTDDDR